MKFLRERERLEAKIAKSFIFSGLNHERQLLLGVAIASYRDHLMLLRT